jgi:hypothetical protein
MMNSPKFKTINDVFTHNFEALHRWRAFISVPRRMPDAVRYFVAQQLDDPETIAGLSVEQPGHRNAVALAFPDKSVLVWPDWMFENEETYNKALDCAEDLQGLGKIWEDIERLARLDRADELFARAVELVESFARFLLSAGAENVLGPKVRNLVSRLNGQLARAFCAGGCQREHACDWLRMVNRAREIGFDLQLSPDAAATLLQRPKPRRAGRLARSLRPRQPGGMRSKIVMANPNPKIKVVFDKDRHVDRCDCSNLFQEFNPKKMSPEALRQCCDMVQIVFRGYQHETRLPMVIPEVRTFLRAVRRAWPYAPFFCDLDNPFIPLEAFAHLDHYSVMEKSDSQELLFTIRTPELRRYVQQAHKTIRMLGQRSRMTDAQVQRRILQFDNCIRRRMGPRRKPQ